jgi:two-component system, chemotaxis family, sensor kinase CheA
MRADKRIIDLLTEPLTHLIRNALDHGIEPPEERRRADKDPQGLITLGIESEEDYLVFTVSDDGRGIHREEILAEAARQGMPEDPGADILHYLTQPGFSTCSEVSSLSGRGLGLDLISRRITKEAGGKLSMETREGRGTSFIIRIPKGFQPRGLLLFKSSGDVYALPSGTVTEVLALEEDRLARDDGGGYTFSGLSLYTPRGRCLAGAEPPGGKTVLIPVPSGSESGLLIDEVLFEQEIPRTR